MDSDHCVMRGLCNRSLLGGQRIQFVRIPPGRGRAPDDAVEAYASSPRRWAFRPAMRRKSLADMVDIPLTATVGVPPLATAWCEPLREHVAEGIVSLRLESLGVQLPTFQPGAHIDVHLPNGLVRQYSLTNGPGETDHYTIGVKRELHSRGGSAAIHDTLRKDDLLAISSPRNNFPLREIPNTPSLWQVVSASHPYWRWRAR